MDRFSHDPFAGPASDDLATQRNNSRDSLLLAAAFRIAGLEQIHQVRIRNLSAGGLMAELAFPIARETAVEIEVRGIGWIPGRIAWTVDGRVGIAFDVPIDPKLARKPVGGGTRTPDYARATTPRR